MGPLLEFKMRYPGDIDAQHGFGIAALQLGRLYLAEFAGHDCSTTLKVATHSSKHLQDPRAVCDQGNIDRLNLRKRWKSTIGDQKTVSVANSAQQVVDRRVQ